jgi:hypothetical protein
MSDEKWRELLVRNEKLVLELHQVRQENAQLKQRLNDVMNWSLLQCVPKHNRNDEGSQTDLHISKSVYHREDECMVDRLPNDNPCYRSNGDLSGENLIPTCPAVPAAAAPSFPHHTKIESCDLCTSPQKRTLRNVRKPITYQEPSLRVKVRKGFQFFKFEKVDEPVNN